MKIMLNQNNNYLNLINDINSLPKNDIDFSKKICKTKYDVLGLSMPSLKYLAKKYSSLNINKIELDKYFEFNYLYIFIGLLQLKTLEEQISFLFENIDHVDSWAITDTTYQLLCKIDFNSSLLLIKSLLSSKKEFLIRYGYLYLFNFKKDKKNLNEILKLLKNSKYYYVKMVEAWLICELFIFNQNEMFLFIKESSLDNEIKLKAISKICDSFRVDETIKKELKKLRTNLKEKC